MLPALNIFIIEYSAEIPSPEKRKRMLRLLCITIAHHEVLLSLLCAFNLWSHLHSLLVVLHLRDADRSILHPLLWLDL